MKLIPLVFALLAPTSSLGGQDTVPTFDRVQADSTFRSEGGTAFDVDGDGAHDLVVGPYWYAGPDFAERYAIWEPTDFDPVGYSDSFFGWPFDGNSDGHTDLFAVGFPGQAAYWFVNPGGRPDGESVAHWTRHEVLAAVDNESPNFIDLVGDAAPELVCQTGGAIGYATPNPGDPTAAWIFHNISPNLELQRFTHGLGTGDVDGDGRRDILWRDGWWRQPESLEGDPVWEEVKVPFSKRGGGAQMFVLDVDDDGDSDVITSLQAHGFGLSWFEQDGSGTSSTWTEHVITDDQPEDSSYGIRFGEIHALDMADMDGDGLLDIVTGKRWWSHGASGDPEPGAPAVAYAFLLRRGEDGVDWLPCLIDDDSGVGVQVQAIDVNQDGRMDVVVGNKKGAFVLYQSEERVPAMAKVQADQSKTQGGDGGVDGDDSFEPQDALGNSLNLDFETGDLTGWHFEGNAFEGQPVLGDTVAARGRGQARHQGKYWMGGYELDGDEPQGTMVSSAFRVRQPWGSFLVGGGYTDMTRIEIVRVADDHVIYKTSGTAYEDMQRVVVDLRQEVGQDVVVRIVDMSSGGWGHINFDDMRLHQERPSFDLPDGLPPILPKDKIQHAGLAPQDAAAAMTVPDGFQVELIASEPDLHQPVAMTIDGRGRIWVAEAHSYPQKRAEGEGLDLIKVLEDRDNNGSFETITVFMDGLNLVSGLEVGHGGVWVGQAPEFMFIPDANDDLIPDGPPEVLLDGWDIRDTHETLNAFNWGPDGWLYGCHGVFSHARVGKPGTPDADRTPMNAGVWRYHPTRHEFEVFAWGSSNPWGVDWNDDGQAFISACVIPHLFHVIQGGRYERQGGTHFQPWVYDDIKTIADHRHYLGATPHGGNLRSNVVGGGHAHCGALLYSGNQFPEEYRNAVFMNNIHGNRVNVDYPVRSGSGFVGEHGDDLLLSNDAWHRGIAFRTGADGSVYLIDWYDKQACHVNDAAIWNRTNGRMYRISYGDSTPIALNIPALSSDELLELLPNRNDFLSRRARIELQERGPDAAIAAKLISAIRSTDERHPRLRFLWALHAIEGLDEGFGLELLADGDEMVTAWTIQLLSEHGTPSAQVLAKFAQLAGDNASPVVRLYLASALQRLDHDARWETLAALSQKGDDAADQNIPYLLWYALAPLVESDPERALALGLSSPIESLRNNSVRYCATLPASLPGLISLIQTQKNDSERTWMLRVIDEALAGERGLGSPEGWSALYADLRKSDDQGIRERALRLSVVFGDASAFPELRLILADRKASAEARNDALAALVRGKDKEAVGTILELLGDDAMRGAALRALASFDDKRVGPALIANYAGYGVEERRDALNTLSSRATYADSLLSAVESDAIPRADIGAFVRRKLANLRDEATVRRAEDVLGTFRASTEETVASIAKWSETLTPEVIASGDRAMGRQVYERTCMQCHTLFGEFGVDGGSLGPELTGSNRRDTEYILSNMLDPNQVIPADYQTTIAWLLDGGVVSGIERGRTNSAITLQTENDTVVIALEDTEEVTLSPLSTMPEGLLDPLSEAEVIDLVAYLQGDEQAEPLPDTDAKGDQTALLFNPEALDGWSGDESLWSIKNGEIIGLTRAGIAENSFLVSENSFANFRLSFEVKLIRNEGNSGVQFRSSREGETSVSGYQADIGKGWWGKLYEEHGRAVLSEGGAEGSVKTAGWNLYIIEANGHHIRTWINGRLSVDLEDSEGARSGFFALQLHSGGPTEVRFRKFKLTVL